MSHPTPNGPAEGLAALVGGAELQQKDPERSKPYRVNEVAAELDVSKHTIYRAIKAGLLHAIRVETGTGPGAVRIPVAAFLAYKARIGAADTTPVTATA